MNLAINSKRIKIILAAIIVLVLLYFCTRGFFLDFVINKIDRKLFDKYKLNLTVNHSEFKGFRGVLLNKLLVKDLHSDTIISSDSVYFQIKILPLLTGKIRFRKIKINDLKANINGELLDKFYFFKKVNQQENFIPDKTNYSKAINRIFTSMFSSIPRDVIMGSTRIEYKRDNIKFAFFCPLFILKSGRFNADISLSDSLNHSDCHIDGSIDNDKSNIDVVLYGIDKQSVSLPYINQKWDLAMKFDTLRLSLNYYGYERETTSFSAFCQTSNFRIEHKRIAPTPVIIRTGKADIVFNIGEKSIEIDSTSLIVVNHFTFSPYLKFRNNGEREFVFRIPHFEFTVESLLSSFPTGLFSSIRDIKANGKLAFEFECYLNWDRPDSIKISSKLSSKDFKILHYGTLNPVMLNDTFTFRVYDGGKLLYKIFVSPENPNYIKLDEISSFLKYSVLTSEDGGFYYHKGFSEESFKNSITENIKKRRFARGGSTITMQLVKNVFLTSNKTISRKLEEIAIVWMIENLHLISKERMFEIYLNIIEWGPGIYGISQAAKYYFKKKPSELNLRESIFLASIIPCPRYFKYAFKEPGKLTDYYAWFYKRLPDLMISRSQILPEDTIGLTPEIILKGEAIDYLTKPDTAKIDSSQFDETIFIENK